MCDQLERRTVVAVVVQRQTASVCNGWSSGILDGNILRLAAIFVQMVFAGVALAVCVLVIRTVAALALLYVSHLAESAIGRPTYAVEDDLILSLRAHLLFVWGARIDQREWEIGVEGWRRYSEGIMNCVRMEETDGKIVKGDIRML